MNSEQMHSRASRVTRRRRIQQGGSILILGTLTILVLFGFMGLAIDASYMYFYKRRMQTAADAGALGAAQEMLRNGSASNPTLTTAAKNDTALNGFTDATGGVVVTVNHPPTSGPSSGNSGFVEVIVTQPQPTWFMRVINPSLTSNTIAARAVAGLGTANGCVYALNRDASSSDDGFAVGGNASAKFYCGVFSNANMRENGGGCVESPTISYVGTYTPPGAAGCPTPPNVSASVPVEDPLAGRYSIPAYTGCDHTNFSINNGAAQTIYPGVYCGGISISGGSTGAVTFDAGAPRSWTPGNPGTPGPPGTGFAASAPNGSYILVGGGLSITGVPVTGTGVTFFNTYNGDPTYIAATNKAGTYGAIDITGGAAAINLSAPTSGVNTALLFYQDPNVTWASNNGSSITGSSTSQFQGIFYFPKTDLTYTGNSTTSGLTGNTVGAGYTMLIGYNIKISGNSKVNSDYSSLPGGVNPLPIAKFTE